MNAANLDESKGDWHQLPNLDHLWLSIRDMDDTAKSQRPAALGKCVKLMPTFFC